MPMSPKRSLFLDADQLTAYRWQSGRLCVEGRFAADGRGFEEFARYLGQHRRSMFYLLAEVVDESFRLDTIPHVRGRDRRAMIERRLDQHCHGTQLSLALSLGRETDGRRDEKLLLAALTRPQHLAPWLAVLESQEVQLAGIYSLPLLAGTLARDLVPKSVLASRSFLLVTLTAGGLRQTFFIDGRMRFSRLTPMASNDPGQRFVASAIESANVRRYLIGQRLVPRSAPLQTMMLVHPDETASFRAHCRDTEELHFEFANLLAVSRQCGLRNRPGDTHSELLFMHLMVQKRPPGQFAHSRERRFYRQGQIRLALRSGGAMILLASLLFAGKQWVASYRLAVQTEQLRLQTEVDRRHYGKILDTLPALPTSIEKLGALIGGYDELAAHSPSLEPMYFRISRALRHSPLIQIDRIDWRARPGPGEGRRRGTDTLRQEEGLKIVADMYARLPGTLAGDHRALLAAIEVFRTDLSKEAGVEVLALKLPFDAGSGKSLIGNGDAVSGTDATTFSLRVVHRP